MEARSVPYKSDWEATPRAFKALCRIATNYSLICNLPIESSSSVAGLLELKYLAGSAVEE